MKTNTNLSLSKFIDPASALVAAFVLICLLMTASVKATIVQEDFAYPTGNIAGQNGGVGWGNPWDYNSNTSGRSQVIGNEALVYTNGGYNIVQTNGAGVFYCN